MPLIVRVTSADSKKVYTRRLEDGTGSIRVPRDAKVALVDAATGEVVPVRPRVLIDGEGEELIVFVGEHAGEEIALLVEGEAALWPADTELASAAMLDAPALPALADGGEARRGAPYERGEGGFGEGGGGISPLGWLLFGALAVGVVAVVAASDSDEEAPTPPPPPPPPPADTTAPGAPTGIDLAAASDTGLRNDDDITSTTTGLVITGNAEPGSTVRLFAGGTQVGGTQTAAAGTGTFSFTVNLPAGTNMITVTATDAAGNVSAASAPLRVIVDTTAPAAPATLDLDPADDTGASNSDNVTNRSTGLTLTGTAEAGSRVEALNGTTSLGSATATAAGSFAIDVSLPGEGAYSLTFRATDPAGNVSPASAALALTVDATAPAAPTGLDLDAADDTGASNSDNLTSLTGALTITGSAPVGTSVVLLAGTTQVGTGTAGAGGTFSIDIPLAAGVHSVTAVAVDTAGNPSPASAPLSITVDPAAPAAPAGLALDAADDDGIANDDGVTDLTQDLTISGTAEPGASVQLFANGAAIGTVTADAAGAFTFDFDAPAAGPYAITASATDAAGNVSPASAPLTLSVGAAPAVVNASIDGNGDVVTLYFDEMLSPGSAPAASQFTITDAMGVALASVTGTEVVGNRVRLFLDAAVDEAAGPLLSYASAPGTVTDASGNAAGDLAGVALANDLSLTGNGGIAIGRTGHLALGGAEIVAFDPASDRFFVTSAGGGLQVVGVDASLNLTLLGTVDLGSNNVTSVSVRNGLVAVAVVAAVKTDPGTVYLLDADAAVGPGMVLGQAMVGALPDMVTFTPDGSKVLVANEGEQSDAGVMPLVNPEGSVSIIDVSNPVAPSVATADFTAYNSQLAALRAEGVRLFAGQPGFDTVTVAQDLEPEYISVSPDGKRALVTLQENNAVAVLDIATATILDIQPLGLKPFLGLPADFSDRDLGGAGGIDLDTDNPVFGQFMPDSIASFTGADGETYYLIANEGDDRDDFISPGETSRLSALMLDPAVFPNAAALQASGELGRLTVSNAPGNNGDADGDGDLDQILAYGARSFSILDSRGNVVFDSGSHIEQFVAAGGVWNAATNAGLFDDSRSDNKGPEPEGITTGVYGSSVLAFVALERGGGGVMVYDVTDPGDVQFVTFFRDIRDVSPEGLVYLPAADSPTGQPVLAVTNEVSTTLSAFEIAPAGAAFTLQLLHLADAEAGLLASTTAPNLAAMVDAFEDQYYNSITLAGGDNFIPGPFFAAGADPSIAPLLGVAAGSLVQGMVDIAIHNAIGVQASTIGNHEFDFGSRGLRDAFFPVGAWVGGQFPYLSANLDFSGDADLAGRFTETLGTGGLESAASLNGRIAPSAVITENGERIGLVGVTTQLLEQISSPTGTEVKGFPTGPGANGEADNMQLLAIQLQPYIDDLIAQGVNKIILMSHLQLLGNERALAPLLTGVDIILAAGSNTRLGDADDVAVAFPGHAADFADTYPILTQGLDGGTTLIVNTDNEFTYLGRLVVDFDAAGNILPGSLVGNGAVNGAYAATDQNVADAWNTTTADLATTAFAAGTRGAQVQALTGAVQGVIDAKSANVFGYSDVYLEGARAAVRTQETNLGNLTADANLDAAKDALGLTASDYLASLKNGGGIRSQIGTVSGTGSNVTFEPNPGGVVSQLDVENSLRFDNSLMVFDTTPQGLLNILNNPAALTPNNGGFLQIGGMWVSYDPSLPAGSRVRDVALVNEAGGKLAIVDDGVVVAGAPATITMVALNFTANGGDGYPIKANGSNFRFLLEDGTVSAAVNPALNFTDPTVVPANVLGEQEAFEEYLMENYGTPALAFDEADTPMALDLRIQNQAVRTDSVLDPAVTGSALGSFDLMVMPEPEVFA